MAAALGLISGLGLGALGGYAKEKVAQKHQSEAAWHDFMTNSLNQHPEIANTPEGQKQIAQIYGKEHGPLVQGFLQMAATAKQKAAQDYQQNVIGGGAVPTAGGPPVASGQPDTPDSLRSLAQRAEAHLADPQYENTYTKSQREMGMAHIKDLLERADKLEAEAQRAKYESPEAKATAATATEKAKKAVDTSSDVVSKEAGAAATIGAARSGAEARAKLAPDIVAGEVSEAGKKSAAESTAKATVAAKLGKPWTPKDALQARTAATNQAQKEVAKGGLLGRISPASGADVRKRAAEILKAEGLDENGQMVVGAHNVTATGPDGKKMVYRSGEWVPM
jgi:hypothetical protein